MLWKPQPVTEKYPFPCFPKIDESWNWNCLDFTFDYPESKDLNILLFFNVSYYWYWFPIIGIGLPEKDTSYN